MKIGCPLGERRKEVIGSALWLIFSEEVISDLGHKGELETIVGRESAHGVLAERKTSAKVSH